MPVYEITGPDGRTYDVTAPEGASPDQVLAFAKSQWAQMTQEKAQPISGLDRFKRGLMDPIDGGAQLLTKALPEGVVRAGNDLNNFIADKTGLVGRLPAGGVDQQIREQEAAYQAQRKASGESGFDAARLAGNILSPANLAIPGASGAVVGRVAPAAGRGAQAVASSAIGGGLSALLSPVTEGDFLKTKAQQVALGLGAGAAVPAIAGGIGRVISPNASKNPMLQMLKSEGVQPTIGQTLGGRMNALEEKAMSIPVLGDAIANARRGAVETFNRAAINRATAPIGQQVDEVGQRGVAAAGNAISDAYASGKNALRYFRIDPQGAQELSTLKAMSQQLPEKEQRAFDAVWSYLRSEVSPNGSLTADSYKRIDSKLGAEIGRFSKSPDAYQQQVADALKEMQRVLDQSLRRSNPQAAKMLGAADEAYANLVRVEGASKAAQNSEGVFTPAQLNAAIRGADKSVRNRAVSRGEALMQDLGNAGQTVLGNKVPDSGTAGRALTAGAITLGGGAVINPAIPIGLVGGAAMYSRPMQSLLNAAVTSRPQSAQLVADSIQESAPRLGPAAAQVLRGLLW